MNEDALGFDLLGFADTLGLDEPPLSRAAFARGGGSAGGGGSGPRSFTAASAGSGGGGGFTLSGRLSIGPFRMLTPSHLA